MRKVIGRAVAVSAMTMFAVTSIAMAKDFGSVSVGCLSNDGPLQAAQGVISPSASPTATPAVSVTLSPSTMWPPNHKLRKEDLSVNLVAALSNPGSTYANGADIQVWVVGVTDDQLSEDGGRGQGCGAPTSKQGLDWSPDVELATPGSYLSGDATLTDTTVTPLSLFDQSNNSETLKLRAERCARAGTRTYTVSVVCCDTTDPNNVVCDDAALATASPTATPSETEDLDVIVPKSHGKPRG